MSTIAVVHSLLMIETDRLIAPAATVRDDREEVQDRAIRPGKLADYVGQPAVKEQMEIFISAARARSEALDHTLILAHPDWARRRSRTLLLSRWASTCATPPGQCWSARVILPRC